MAVTGSLGAEARRAAMLERLGSVGKLLLSESAEQWQVHPMTVRRDFEYLDTVGLARRVRGGLVAITGDDYLDRRARAAGAKARIGEKLAAMVEDGMTIGLDASTTVQPLTASLRERQGLSVVTNSLTAFDSLRGAPGVRTFLTGGEREEQHVSLVGPLAVRAFSGFNLDIAFMSAGSIDERQGTSEVTIEQVAVKEAMADAAQRVVLAVDTGKLGTRSRVRSLPLSRFDAMVTEVDPAHPVLQKYRPHLGELR